MEHGTTHCGLPVAGSWNSERNPKSCRHFGNQKHSAALGSEHQHQQAVQGSGRNIEKREMEKVKTLILFEKQAKLGLTCQSLRDMHVAHFEKCADVLEGGDPWARRTRRCAAAVKGDVMVEVSDGQGRLRELVRIEALRPKLG